MTSRRQTQVTVIVDNIVQGLGRRSYWGYYFSSKDNGGANPYASYDIRYLSLSESLGNGSNPIQELFDYQKSQVVIINWDAINGDPLYNADKALNLLKHYAKDMDAWVELGGVVIVECQESSRELTEEAYRLFTEDGRYPFHIKNGKEHHDKLSLNQGLHEHPLLKGLTTEHTPDKNFVKNRPVMYPRTKGTAKLEDERWTEKIFFGVVR